MTYFSRTHVKIWGENRWKETGAAPMVAHDRCLPDNQFETIGSTENPLRTQKNPWCWAPTYGGIIAVKEGQMDYESPRHICHYCGLPTP